MPTSKVAYFSGVGGRAEFMIEQAPPELEITLVDPRLSDEEQVQLCKDTDAIISSYISTDVLRQCPNVKLIQTLSAGYDRLDLEAILEMGIPVANNGGANAIAVAEHSIALMINVGKRL
ncbi:MAG: lactate dehydrogenase, partial [Dehalococcoidia bacterium]